MGTAWGQGGHLHNYKFLFPTHSQAIPLSPSLFAPLRQAEGEMTRQNRHGCKARRADRQTSARKGWESIQKRIRAP
jgi:hypothetical protein